MIDMDFTVRLGDLLQAGVIAAGGLIVFTQMRSESAANKNRLDRVDGELAKQTDILTRLASGEERMNGLSQRITSAEQRILSQTDIITRLMARNGSACSLSGE
jgi:hypothetical protein